MSAVIFQNPAPDGKNCPNPAEEGVFSVPECGYCEIMLTQSGERVFCVLALIPGTADYVPYIVNGEPVKVGSGQDTKVTITQPGRYAIEIPDDLAEDEQVTVSVCCYEECAPALGSAGGIKPDPTMEFTGLGVTTFCDINEGWIDKVFCKNKAGDITVLYYKGDTQMPGDYTPAVDTSGSNEQKVLEAEVRVTFAPTEGFTGTVADVLATATLPTFTGPNGFSQDATAAEICAYGAYAMECGAKYLATDGDLSTSTSVEVDDTYIDGKGVRCKEDDAFAGADLTDTVTAAAGTVSCWTFKFKLEGECDKAGNFTPAAPVKGK